MLDIHQQCASRSGCSRSHNIGKDDYRIRTAYGYIDILETQIYDRKGATRR